MLFTADIYHKTDQIYSLTAYSNLFAPIIQIRVQMSMWVNKRTFLRRHAYPNIYRRWITNILFIHRQAICQIENLLRAIFIQRKNMITSKGVLPTNRYDNKTAKLWLFWNSNKTTNKRITIEGGGTRVGWAFILIRFELKAVK